MLTRKEPRHAGVVGGAAELYVTRTEIQLVRQGAAKVPDREMEKDLEKSSWSGCNTDG